ncbi:hypothetical protein Lxx19450 [Leifsonia xyli subsp. xyli str. CTCB07]|uniref:Uncharacterized protein n=2 Tax=Leifsonia xyli subsp. xyli TaxID=59736 RepID=Q6AD79_LEIXX|nr:hypothetical protein [Leifsonia xyli]AAT89665.1 hypothetical protein Lxx19450 [Leifsonia xyli subsp. xyli str. CTCB07]
MPDWRFFAPRPMTTDVLLFARTLDVAGETSPWVPLTRYPRRSATQLLFFPDRRRSKALLDVTNLFLNQLAANPGAVERLPMYRLLADRARVLLEPFDAGVLGFQFCVVKDNGHEGGDIDIPFISGYLSLAAERSETDEEK